jgi:metal-responsive CopG/Arc/MetJ family transcriptional regulator
MRKTKIAITLDATVVQRLDGLVRDAAYPSRSRAVEVAVAEKLARLDRRRLAEECAKLAPSEERALAEEGLGKDAAAWPEY